MPVTCAFALVAACAAAAPGVAAPPPAAPVEIRIGLLAPEGRFDVLHQWEFVAPALERALPGYRVRVEPLDVDTLKGVVARSQADFFIANSGFYVEMESAHGASALATVDSPLALSPQEALGAAIVVLNNRHDLNRLADLRGKRVVAVNEQLFGGFQVPLHALHEAGVERGDLAGLRMVGIPVEQMLEELVGRHADAAILRVCLLELLTQSPRFRPAAFRVLEVPADDRFRCARSTPLYPDWSFARLKSTDVDLAKKVSLALMAMPRTADGYAWTVPTNHERVHAVLRDLEIGPYEYLSRRTVGGFFLRYKVAFTLLGIVLLGIVLHLLRVEVLVKRRTGELRRALLERDRIAEEARSREEQIEHLSRLGMLGEMSSMLAHELNQPLSAIANFAHGIIRRIDAGLVDPQPLAQASEEIARQAERAAGIMDRVRGFSRKRREARARCDLADVVTSAIALYEAMLPGACAVACDWRDDCGDGAPAIIDRLQIEQVLLNLLKNACDAMHELPPPERRVRIALSRADAGYRIAVADCGPGPGPADVARLFTPFYTTKHEGIGLGLAICKRVVEAHGGHIEAASNAPAAGLTVAFTLPAAPPTGAAPAAPPAVANASEEPLCPMP